MPANLRIGIIGDGNVGSALRDGLERAGYEVEAVGKEPRRVREVAERAELVVLAVPFSERENAIEEMGETIEGKTLVDVTNALTPDYAFAADVTKSGAEELQEIASHASVVKAFNTVFAKHMSKGRVKGEPLSLFVAGDDAEAKDEVVRLGKDLGFEPVDTGPLENARWLETLGYLNIRLGYDQKLGTDIGFRLVGAPSAVTGRASRAGSRTRTRPSGPRRQRRTATERPGLRRGTRA